MIADTYQPNSSAHYAEDSSAAVSQLPDERTGVFVLTLPKN